MNPVQKLAKTTRKKNAHPEKSGNEEIREMRRFLQQKQAARRAALEKRFSAATRDFERIVEMIIRKY